jgi:hypothetical protein
LILVIVSAIAAIIAAYVAPYPLATIIELASVSLCAVSVFRAKRLAATMGAAVLIWASFGAATAALFPNLAVARADREIARLETGPSVHDARGLWREGVGATMVLPVAQAMMWGVAGVAAAALGGATRALRRRHFLAASVGS